MCACSASAFYQDGKLTIIYPKVCPSCADKIVQLLKAYGDQSNAKTLSS